MSIIVKAKIKELAVVDDKKINVASDFADKLDEEVTAMVKKACARALANSRTTVMPKDL